MKRCLVLIAIILATACTTLGQQAAGDTSASREDIRKLFDVMHIRDQMKQVMDQVLKQMKSMGHEQIKKHHPEVSEEKIAKLDAMSDQYLKDIPIDGMLDDMVPLWAIAEEGKLSRRAQQIYTGPNDLWLSVASVWEILIKVRAGRLPLPEPSGPYLS